MKKRSDRITPVTRVSESRERDAARQLGESNRQVDLQLQKLKELENYLEEYTQYCQQQGEQGISASRFVELQRFLDNLKVAVEQQRKLVATSQQGQVTKQGQWQQAHNRTRAMDTVADRYRQQERVQAERQEQKESDEIGQRKGDSGGTKGFK